MSRSRPTLVLLLACVAQFMLLVDDTITNVALPTIGRELHFSVANLSWVVNAYPLTFGGLLLIGGRLADRFGRGEFSTPAWPASPPPRRCAGSPPAPERWSARGRCRASSARCCHRRRWRAPGRLARRRGAPPCPGHLGRALGLGAATGLLAGGALVQLADWRWIFLINVPVAAAALAAIPRVLAPDDLSARRSSPNVGGAALATMALLLLVYTVVETDSHAWTLARTLGGLAGSC